MSRLNQSSSRPPPRAEALLDLPGGPSAILRLGQALWCVLDQRGAFLRHGEVWSGALGWPDAVFHRLCFWELMHPEDVSVAAGFGHAPALRGPTRITTRVLSAYAAYLHVQWSAEPLAGGRWLVVGHDVTDHVIAVRQLREAQARYDSVCDAVFEAVVIHEDGRIIDANRSAREMLGYSGRELIGRQAHELLPPAFHAQRLRAGVIDEGRAAIVRRDGSMLDVFVRSRSLVVGDREQRVLVILPA